MTTTNATKKQVRRFNQIARELMAMSAEAHAAATELRAEYDALGRKVHGAGWEE